MHNGRSFIHTDSSTMVTFAPEGPHVMVSVTDRGKSQALGGYLTAEQARQAAEELLGIADDLDPPLATPVPAPAPPLATAPTVHPSPGVAEPPAPAATPHP